MLASWYFRPIGTCDCELNGRQGRFMVGFFGDGSISTLSPMDGREN